MTRAKHIQWCKDRALAYVDAGDLKGAMASMTSDLGKHEETNDHIGIQLAFPLIMSGGLSSAHEVREFIEGFN